MKKLVMLALVALSGAAFAGGFGSVDYTAANGVNGNTDSNLVRVMVGTDVTDSIKVDVSQLQKTADSGNAIKIDRTELAGTYSTPIATGLTGYVRAGIGEKYFTKSDSNFSYYTVEPGVKYAVTPNLTAKVGYRYRAAMDSANSDTTRTWRTGLEYAVTKNYSVNVGYDQSRGLANETSNNVSVGLGVRF
jgi:opacity protein-like surface antigen